MCRGWKNFPRLPDTKHHAKEGKMLQQVGEGIPGEFGQESSKQNVPLRDIEVKHGIENRRSRDKADSKDEKVVSGEAK